MTLFNEGDSQLSLLIENSMERASLVLAAQSITDKLQNMAETLAKIEVSDVIPMIDSMKEQFGPEVAQRFEGVVSGKLREMSESLRTARDDIGNEIIRMEASVNGTPVSDMQMDGMDSAPAGDSDMEMDSDPVADAAAAAAPDASAAPAADAPTDAAPAGDDFSNLFGDAADTGPAGRARKEGVEHSGAKALRESTNPDALVRKLFAETVKKDNNAAFAVDHVAEYYEIDADDVIDIILESRKGR
jgi:hypothetical protein